MACTNPQCALIPLRGGSPIFSRLVDIPADSVITHPHHGVCRVVYLPCGGCLCCRRERRQELTLLQCCEASLYDDNWFVTLTYDDAYFAARNSFTPRSLVKQHLSDFLVGMRKYCSYHDATFRYFAVGEYGSINLRPHYHLSVFGLPPKVLGLPDVDTNNQRKGLSNDGVLRRQNAGVRDAEGIEYWRSDLLSRRWPYGNHRIYRANKDTFQYVAGYVTKKLTGNLGRDFNATGRICEYQTQSRPSIGRAWFDRFYSCLSNPSKTGELINDTLAIAGVEWKCPRIFGKWLAVIDQFDGPLVAERLATMRRLLNATVEPDRLDLSRKSDFERYRAAQVKQNNKHKEIQNE